MDISDGIGDDVCSSIVADNACGNSPSSMVKGYDEIGFYTTL